MNDGLPPAAGPVSGDLWRQVVKDLSTVGGRLGALQLVTRSSAHSADSSLGEGTQTGKCGIGFLTMSSLRWPRDDAAETRKTPSALVLSVSWLRRHGKSGSVQRGTAPSR